MIREDKDKNKANAMIDSINEQLYDLSEKDFSLFVTLCASISDNLNEEVERLYDYETMESVCGLIDDDFFCEY